MGEDCANLWFTVLQGPPGTLDERFDDMTLIHAERRRDLKMILMGRDQRHAMRQLSLRGQPLPKRSVLRGAAGSGGSDPCVAGYKRVRAWRSGSGHLAPMP